MQLLLMELCACGAGAVLLCVLWLALGLYCCSELTKELAYGTPLLQGLTGLQPGGFALSVGLMLLQ